MYGVEECLISCCGEIYLTLGSGYKECVYQRALAYELTSRNLNVSTEVNVNIYYKDIFIGYERADIVISNPKTVIELKAQSQKISYKELFQTHRYLLDLNLQTGYLINFTSVGYKITSENIKNAIEIYKVENSPERECLISKFDGEQFIRLNL